MKLPPIKVVSNEEAEAADFVVTMRAADLQPPAETDRSPSAEWQRKVIARSQPEPCSVCGEQCLRDTLSPRRPPLLCMHCALEIQTATKQ